MKIGITLLLALFLVPISAHAIVYDGYLELEGGVGSVGVAITDMTSSTGGYEYYYYFTNNSADAFAITNLSVGYGSTDPDIDLKDITPVAGTVNIPGASYAYISSDSVMAYYFGTALMVSPGDTYEFSVHFNSAEMVQQRFGAFNAATNSTLGGKISYGGEPVPEPATLLLLGSGIFGAGIISRKRRQKK